MQCRTLEREFTAIERDLDMAGQYNRRAKMSSPQHRRAIYRLKDQALARALLAGRDEFVVDSVLGADPLVLGISHRFSGRRFHVRPTAMPPEVREVLAELPRASADGQQETMSPAA